MRRSAVLHHPANARPAAGLLAAERLPPGLCVLFVLTASAGLWALLIALVRALL